MIETEFQKHRFNIESMPEAIRISSDSLAEFVLQRFKMQTKLTRPFTVALGGISASGKSVCSRHMKFSLSPAVISTILDIDSYLFDNVQTTQTSTNYSLPFYLDGFNPQNIDFEALINDIQKLQNGQTIQAPVIERSSHIRIGHQMIEPGQVIIIEGTRALDEEIAQNADLKCLIEANLHTRFIRRCLRNVRQYGKDLNLIIIQYLTQIEPAYEYFLPFLRRKVDVIAENPGISWDYILIGPIDDSTGSQSISPLPEYGVLNPGEFMRILHASDQEQIFQYGFQDRILLQSPIQDEVITALKKYYAFY